MNVLFNYLMIGKPDPASIYIKMDNEELEYELREYY